MIKRKAKFVQASFETEELGERNSLMQDAGHRSKGTTGPGKPMPLTLDEKIEQAQYNLHHVTDPDNKATKEQIEAAKLEYDKLMKQKEVTLQVEADLKISKMQTNASFDNETRRFNAEIEKAKLSRDGTVRTAQIQQDPNQINQTEMEVFNIIKKYDLLKDPSAFQNMVNNSTDKDVKQDALTLERDLAKLGMHLKVDGNIDQHTIDAVESLVSKNAPAIKAYTEVTGTNPVRPSAVPMDNVPAVQKDGR